MGACCPDYVPTATPHADAYAYGESLAKAHGHARAVELLASARLGARRAGTDDVWAAYEALMRLAVIAAKEAE